MFRRTEIQVYDKCEDVFFTLNNFAVGKENSRISDVRLLDKPDIRAITVFGAILLLDP